jgi:hypothetical protein
MNKTQNDKWEVESDAWSPFERAVDVVAKFPPQHRTNAIKDASCPNKKKEKPDKRK